METRTFKWRYKRVELDAERSRLSTMLLDTSEELMKIHSDISKRAFDKMMGEPIEELNELQRSIRRLR